MGYSAMWTRYRSNDGGIKHHRNIGLLQRDYTALCAPRLRRPPMKWSAIAEKYEKHCSTGFIEESHKTSVRKVVIGIRTTNHAYYEACDQCNRSGQGK
jgi:hypothetical protein